MQTAVQTTNSTTKTYGKPLPKVTSLNEYIAREKRWSNKFFFAARRYAVRGQIDRAMLADSFAQLHRENWRNAELMSERQFRCFFRAFLRDNKTIRELRYAAANPPTQLKLW